MESVAQVRRVIVQILLKFFIKNDNWILLFVLHTLKTFFTLSNSSHQPWCSCCFFIWLTDRFGRRQKNKLLLYYFFPPSLWLLVLVLKHLPNGFLIIAMYKYYEDFIYSNFLSGTREIEGPGTRQSYYFFQKPDSIPVTQLLNYAII